MAIFDTLANTIKSDLLMNSKVSNNSVKTDLSDNRFSNVLNSVNKTMNFNYKESLNNKDITKDASYSSSQNKTSSSFSEKVSSEQQNNAKDTVSKNNSEETSNNAKNDIDKNQAKTENAEKNKINKNEDPKVDKQNTTDSAKDETTSETVESTDNTQENQTNQTAGTEVKVEVPVDTAFILKDLINIQTTPEQAVKVEVPKNADITDIQTGTTIQESKTKENNIIPVQNQTDLTSAKSEPSKGDAQVLSTDAQATVPIQDKNTETENDKIDLKVSENADVKDLETKSESPDKNTKGIEFQTTTDEATESISYSDQQIGDDFNQKIAKASEKLDKIETSDKPVITKVEVNSDSTKQNSNPNNPNMQNEQSADFSMNNFASIGEKNIAQGINSASSFSNTLNTLNNKTANVSENMILNQVSTNAAEGLKNSGLSKISMVLNPESLGKVTLELVNSAQEGLSAQFVAENKEVKEALSKNLDTLKQNLQDQGITVNNLVVKVQESQMSNNSQFDFQQNQNNFKFGQYDQNAGNNGQGNNKNNNGGNAEPVNNIENGLNEDNTARSEFLQGVSASHSGRVDYTV